ncbi:LacI family transcriptional regulator [Afipia sp. Root123D2]|uniref:LacI family DNA-binding transcriptional regulator n=1 Tax=Afipia sp. Root123D2 TaxID=1736436 RepID=UPI0006FDB7F9|nr:LacI family DNA-binding transcriptional regulator [Afipia sp. Root123D2]KQW20664.1 LacI family transcriptional regulator [Afipia sp. Root123D2]
MNTISQNLPLTSKDIARVAKVSQATVSRVLSGNPNVQAETRERVLAVMRQMNYRPNGMARAMRTNRTGNIGVVVSRLANPLYPEMLQILGQQLTEAGLRMMVWNTDETDEGAAASAVRESLVDGVIMTTATAFSTPLYEAVMMNAPVVLIHRVVEGWPCDQVSSDNAQGAISVADYVVKSGRKRIGLIDGPPLASTIRARQTAFRSRLNELGRPLDPSLAIRVDSFSHKTGFDAASYLLDLAQPPDVIFCVNDVIALGARDAARARGVDVPGQLWLIGYDDIEMAAWPAFDLTTVRQPLKQMAHEAVALLRDRIGGAGRDHTTICLPTELVIRGSTGGHRTNR